MHHKEDYDPQYFVQSKLSVEAWILLRPLKSDEFKLVSKEGLQFSLPSRI
jgi:hypothetical protein